MSAPCSKCSQRFTVAIVRPGTRRAVDLRQAPLRRAELGAKPDGGAFPSDAKIPRLTTSGVGGLRNSPFLHLRARTVLGLLPPPAARLGASRWGPLAPPPGVRRLRTRAKRLLAIWRKQQRSLRGITLRDSKRLGIVGRIVETDRENPSTHGYAPAYSALHK